MSILLSIIGTSIYPMTFVHPGTSNSLVRGGNIHNREKTIFFFLWKWLEPHPSPSPQPMNADRIICFKSFSSSSVSKLLVSNWSKHFVRTFIIFSLHISSSLIEIRLYTKFEHSQIFGSWFVLVSQGQDDLEWWLPCPRIELKLVLKPLLQKHDSL